MQERRFYAKARSGVNIFWEVFTKSFEDVATVSRSFWSAMRSSRRFLGGNSFREGERCDRKLACVRVGRMRRHITSHLTALTSLPLQRYIGDGFLIPMQNCVFSAALPSSWRKLRAYSPGMVFLSKSLSSRGQLG